MNLDNNADADEELYRAAFHTAVECREGTLNSKQELRSALCLAGRNPSLKSLNSLWKNKPIDYQSFHDLLPLVDKLDCNKLVEAFARLSPKRKKSIHKDKLTDLLSSCGEALSKEEIDKFLQSISSVDKNIIDSRGDINYLHLCDSIVKSCHEFQEYSLQSYQAHQVKEYVTEIKSTTVNSPASSHQSLSTEILSEQGDSIIQSRNIQSSIYGCFLYDDESEQINQVCHQYEVDICDDKSSVEFLINCTLSEFNVNDESIDTRLFLLSKKDLSIIPNGITLGKSTSGEYSCKVTLPKGIYQIIPFITGWKQSRSKEKPEDRVKLVTKERDTLLLTDAFKSALEKIFKIMDTDGNNLLNRQEFNLFNWRTSGEEVADDEWAVVQENFELKDDELTLQGFFDLHLMEAEDNDGEEDDLWITLNFMGFDENLNMTQVWPFQIKAITEVSPLKFNVIDLNANQKAISRYLPKYIIDHDETVKQSIEKDLNLFHLQLDNWACIAIENKSMNEIKIKIDCSNSINCTSTGQSLIESFFLPPQSSRTAFEMMPADPEKPWKVFYSYID